MISKGMALNTFSYPFGASQTLFAADFGAAFTDLEVTGATAGRARAANGITWTSPSGVFLSQPVPEPGTWALMLLGGLATATAVRRRQRS
jgi:PEP-CTERM motif